MLAILDELEEWERYLKAESEVTHKLRAFEEAVDVGEDKPKETPNRPARTRGPSL